MALLITDLICFSEVFFFFPAVLLLMCHSTSVINLTFAPLVANYSFAWLSPRKGLIHPFTSAVPVFTFGSNPKAILGSHNQDQFKKTKNNNKKKNLPPHRQNKSSELLSTLNFLIVCFQGQRAPRGAGDVSQLAPELGRVPGDSIFH